MAGRWSGGIAVVCAAALAAPAGWGTLAVARAAPPPGTGPLTWSDEFDGTVLDPTRWTHLSQGPFLDALNTPAAVSVGGGALTIDTFTEAGRHYTGMIGTRRTALLGFEQAYGYFEARMRFDSAPGQWSAFWLSADTIGDPVGDPANAGVEMDVAEHRTRCVTAPAPTPPEVCDPDYDISDRINRALVWDGYGDDSKSAVRLSDPLPGLGNGSWHTWGLRWTPTRLTFYYDDDPLWSQTKPISRRTQYIVLSSHVGELFAGPAPPGGYGSAATSTANVQVDYVRVWSLS